MKSPQYHKLTRFERRLQNFYEWFHGLFSPFTLGEQVFLVALGGLATLWLILYFKDLMK